jgi:hypothetical protein
MKGDWFETIPVWNSRPNSEGGITTFSTNLWVFALVGCLAVLNVLFWGAIGLIEAVQYIIGLV